MSANDVTFIHRRFALKGGMTADFKEAAKGSHPITGTIYVLSCKEAGSGREVLAWSTDVDWGTFNWEGAKVKLFCDGWVNEFVVAESSNEPEYIRQDKRIFECMFRANVTVEKSLSAEYPENGDYLKGLVLCLWQPEDVPNWAHPVFKRPNDEVIKAYEKYVKELESSAYGLHLYRMCGSKLEDKELVYSFAEVLSEGEYDEYELPNTDVLSKNCGCPRSRYTTRSVIL